MIFYVGNFPRDKSQIVIDRETIGRLMRDSAKNMIFISSSQLASVLDSVRARLGDNILDSDFGKLIDPNALDKAMRNKEAENVITDEDIDLVVSFLEDFFSSEKNGNKQFKDLNEYLRDNVSRLIFSNGKVPKNKSELLESLKRYAKVYSISKMLIASFNPYDKYGVLKPNENGEFYYNTGIIEPNKCVQRGGASQPLVLYKLGATERSVLPSQFTLNYLSESSVPAIPIGEEKVLVISHNVEKDQEFKGVIDLKSNNRGSKTVNQNDLQAQLNAVLNQYSRFIFYLQDSLQSGSRENDNQIRDWINSFNILIWNIEEQLNIGNVKFIKDFFEQANKMQMEVPLKKVEMTSNSSKDPAKQDNLDLKADEIADRGTEIGINLTKAEDIIAITLAQLVSIDAALTKGIVAVGAFDTMSNCDVISERLAGNFGEAIDDVADLTMRLGGHNIAGIDLEEAEKFVESVDFNKEKAMEYRGKLISRYMSKLAKKVCEKMKAVRIEITRSKIERLRGKLSSFSFMKNHIIRKQIAILEEDLQIYQSTNYPDDMDIISFLAELKLFEDEGFYNLDNQVEDTKQTTQMNYLLSNLKHYLIDNHRGNNKKAILAVENLHSFRNEIGARAETMYGGENGLFPDSLLEFFGNSIDESRLDGLVAQKSVSRVSEYESRHSGELDMIGGKHFSIGSLAKEIKRLSLVQSKRKSNRTSVLPSPKKADNFTPKENTTDSVFQNLVQRLNKIAEDVSRILNGESEKDRGVCTDRTGLKVRL